MKKFLRFSAGAALSLITGVVCLGSTTRKRILFRTSQESLSVTHHGLPDARDSPKSQYSVR